MKFALMIIFLANLLISANIIEIKEQNGTLVTRIVDEKIPLSKKAEQEKPKNQNTNQQKPQNNPPKQEIKKNNQNLNPQRTQISKPSPTQNKAQNIQKQENLKKDKKDKKDKTQTSFVSKIVMFLAVSCIIAIIIMGAVSKQNKRKNPYILVGQKQALEELEEDEIEQNARPTQKQATKEKPREQIKTNQIPAIAQYTQNTKRKTQNKDYKKVLGDKYELQVGKYFEKMNFKIYYNGINQGKLDGGIDIIAWSSKQVLLIQCKNHKEQIKQHLIKQFVGDCAVYEKKYKFKIKDREIKRFFVSNSPADYGARQFLKESENIVEFLQIEAECRFV